MKCTCAFVALLISSSSASLLAGQGLSNDVIDFALVGCPVPRQKVGLLQKLFSPNAVMLHNLKLDLKAEQEAHQRALHWQLHWGCVGSCGPAPVLSMCVTDCEVDMYQCIDGAGPGETQQDIDDCQDKVLAQVAKENGVVRKELVRAKVEKGEDFLDQDYIHDDRPEVLPRTPCSSNCKRCTADGKTCTECKSGYDIVKGECQAKREQPGGTSHSGTGAASARGEPDKLIIDHISEHLEEFGKSEKEQSIAVANATQEEFGRMERSKPPRPLKPLKPIARRIEDRMEEFGKSKKEQSIAIANATREAFGKMERSKPPRPLKPLEPMVKSSRPGGAWGKSIEVGKPNKEETDNTAEKPKPIARSMRGAAKSRGRATKAERSSGSLSPLNGFMPSCLLHLKRLIKMIDHSYTDMQLQRVLENECLAEKDFPNSCDSGFAKTKHCRDFAEQLYKARMLELDTGSEKGYRQVCKDYWQLRMGVEKSMSE